MQVAFFKNFFEPVEDNSMSLIPVSRLQIILSMDVAS